MSDFEVKFESTLGDSSSGGITQDQIDKAISNYFASHPVVDIDDTLTKTGSAADAKTVGDKMNSVSDSIPQIDATLKNEGSAADAKVVGEKLEELSDLSADVELSIKYKGEWSGTTEYSVNDLVTASGTKYLCIKESKYQDPTVVGNEYWTEF